MPEIVAPWVSGFSLGLLVVAFWMVCKTQATVVRLERRIEALLEKSGVDIHAAARREAGVLVRAGRTIEAVKVYRQLTGVGLAEAKAAVDQLS